ncbi:hypothetical protein AAG570_001823 [Ranatra chinensis]|uniref:Mitochondrial import inner membrane translocase subunit Tim21 n=1 Tax=Ranatra chinensis TaxID=642074 RepID=A0ABD0Y9N4_9HEMI
MSFYATGRYYSQETKSPKELSTSVPESGVQMSVKEAVKETTKTVSYLGVIVVGVGVTGVMFYAIFRELFSSKSPNSVYAKALDKCCADTRVKDALGEPIKGFGEETRRGRRRHVSHVLYEKDGVNHLRMHFYLKGSRKRGTVQLEMKEDSSGNYVYRYLFVQLDDYSGRIIVLEDNRLEASNTPFTPIVENGDFTKPLNLS